MRTIRLAGQRPGRLLLRGLAVPALLAVWLPLAGAHGVGRTAAAAQNAIQAENALPGDTTWDDFASVAQQDAVSGYGSRTSVNHGDSLDLFVTTTAASVSIDVFRTGWYGGAGARKVVALGSFPGQHQAIPAPDPVTGVIACTWARTTTLAVPSSWVSGVYLAKLTASSGNKSFIFFVVRNDGGTEAIDFQTSVTTYQAYNVWGGVSLYDNQTNKAVYKYPHATKVSFDRPFDPLDNNGTGHFLSYEYPMLRWAEKSGYDLSYTTDVDTDTGINPLTNHRAFLSIGHDEYWSKGMRDRVEAARDAGVNLAFFSANTAYWQIRFEPSASGVPNRVEVGYKDFATATTAPGPDPQLGLNNATVTTRWRDDPVKRPENALLGVMYEDQVQQNDAYVVQNPSSWIYAGTGFTDGSSVPGIVGYEYDRTFANGATPAGLTVLSNSPVVGCCEGTGSSHAQSTLYTAASGAKVFAAGTIQWGWGLDNYSATYANAGIQRTTANILDSFGSGASTAPAVSLSPTSLTFSSQAVGATSPAQSVQLTNSGSAPLTVSGATLTGSNPGDFSQSSDCPGPTGTLAAGSSCTFSVTFSPSGGGTRTAALTVSDNAAGSPHSVSLSGTGLVSGPAVSLSPSSLAFGGVRGGDSSGSLSSSLTNSGTTALTLSSVALGGADAADFALTSDCPAAPATLAPTAACQLAVTFTPSATRAESASVVLTDDATGSPQSLPLTGTGTAPVATLQPASIAFDKQLLQTASASQTVTVKNTGSAPMTVTAVALAGASPASFAVTSNSCPAAPATLAPSASCAVGVAFQPTAVGSVTASLQVFDDAAGSPQPVALSGTGVTSTPVLFSDGFETGALPGPWTSTKVSTTNSLTLDAASAHSGAAGLKAVLVKGSAGNAYVTKTVSGVTALDARAYVYLTKPVNFGAVQLMSFYAQGRFVGWLTYSVDPSSPTLTVYNGATNRSTACGPGPSLGAWHAVEMQYVLSTTTSGSFTVWVDGRQVCSVSAVKTSPASGALIDQVRLGSDGSDKTAGLTIAVDDVVLSKSYIGP